VEVHESFLKCLEKIRATRVQRLGHLVQQNVFAVLYVPIQTFAYEFS